MTQRIDYMKTPEEGMKAFASVGNYVKNCGLPISLIDLVYLRVSQINGCAYCIGLHSHDLLKGGLAVDKLVLVSVWHETGELFSAKERAALAWAETVTHVADTNVPDSEYEAVKSQFSDKELVDLTMAISLMNAYNRMAISFRTTPAAARSHASKSA